MRTLNGKLNRVGKTEHQKAIAKLDATFAKMIRERDWGLPCIVCEELKPLEAGHFRKRGEMSARFDYRNVNGECAGCNRADYSGYGEGKSYEYSLGLDRRWGRGTAARLYMLSRKMKNWDVRELEALAAAAKMGFPVYKQLYDQLTSVPKAA